MTPRIKRNPIAEAKRQALRDAMRECSLETIALAFQDETYRRGYEAGKLSSALGGIADEDLPMLLRRQAE